ncbi:uncharacterized protein V1510DRAFT_410519 [Dipodascopsis tothii]|uniref:uncharacterized protein n=1 Tax=Dipodascopsis tothii TaxID=44089 RepID=UPI0034CE4EF5
MTALSALSYTRIRTLFNPPEVAAVEGSNPVRIGLLGAARIAPAAIIRPAKLIPSEAVIYAVAARDKARATEFATTHGIEKVYTTYEELLADPAVEMVYNALPISLHMEWTLKAVEAGKHVLLEKPCAMDSEQARATFAAAKAKGVLVMEAFHWYFHPANQLVKRIVSDEATFGKPTFYEGHLCVGLGRFSDDSDIRFVFNLGGGSTMDTGCYPISWMRYFLAEEPTAAKLLELIVSPKDERIDEYVSYEFSFADPAKKALVHTGLRTPLTKLLKHGLVTSVTIRSDKKELFFRLSIMPHLYHSITVKDLATGKKESFSGYEAGREHWTTYTYQLKAFCERVRGGDPGLWFENENSVKNMEAIEMAYKAAALPVRHSG